MHLVQKEIKPRSEVKVHGLAGWVLSLLGREGLFARGSGRSSRKHMRVVEALPMGPKRNLFLISCDGERFLVGAGTDSVQTIVRVRPESNSLGLVRGGELGL